MQLLDLQSRVGNHATAGVVRHVQRSDPEAPPQADPVSSTELSAREAAITPAMVAAQAGTRGAGAWLAFTLATALGMSRLGAAANALAGAGLRDEIDLTDALFALVHPEMRGARIGADQEDLKQEWLKLRNEYVRPAVRTDAPKRTPPDRPTTSPKTPAVPEVTPTPSAGTPEEEYAGFSPSVQKAFGRYGGLPHYLAIRHLYEKRPETQGKNPGVWFSELQFAVTWCGATLHGVHPRLLSKLRSVEKECARHVAAMPEGVPVVFEGKFQPRTVTGDSSKLSDHALGLALHLNYENNPYVGRDKGVVELIKRIAAEAGQPAFWDTVKGKDVKGVGGKPATTSEQRIEDIYKAWADTSDAVAKYFLEMDALKATAGDLGVDRETRRRATEEYAKRQKAYQLLRRTDLKMSGGASRDPRAGLFLHTAQIQGDPMLHIIKQLTGPAGLEWGGAYTGQAKDLHHFALKA